MLRWLGSLARGLRGIAPRTRAAGSSPGSCAGWCDTGHGRRSTSCATGGSLAAPAAPDVVTEGFVFLGRRVELQARRGYGRLVLGRWVHLGDENRLRAHEGTLRIGDKCVFGRDNT